MRECTASPQYAPTPRTVTMRGTGRTERSPLPGCVSPAGARHRRGDAPCDQGESPESRTWSRVAFHAMDGAVPGGHCWSRGTRRVPHHPPYARRVERSRGRSSLSRASWCASSGRGECPASPARARGARRGASRGPERVHDIAGHGAGRVHSIVTAGTGCRENRRGRRASGSGSGAGYSAARSRDASASSFRYSGVTRGGSDHPYEPQALKKGIGSPAPSPDPHGCGSGRPVASRQLAW